MIRVKAQVWTVLGFLLLSFQAAKATLYTSPSLAWLDVSNTIALAQPGDTVVLPAGYAAWTSSEIPVCGITIMGTVSNGVNQTIIGDNFGASMESFNRFFVVTPTNTALTRIAYIIFQDAGDAAHNYRGKLEFDSRANLPGAAWRLDHCNFINLNGDNIYVHGFANSVIDHCTFILQGIGVHQSGITFTDPYGDISYATPPYYGTNVSPCSPLYIENCLFTNIVPNSSSSAAYDALAGARSVFRDNVVLNTFWANHGNDTGDRYRSCRSFEIYNNTFVDTQVFPNAMDFRGGAGYVYSNTVTGYTFMDTAENYRSVEYNSWGEANGTNSWDENVSSWNANGMNLTTTTFTNSGVSGGVYAIGPISQGTVTVAGANWVSNQWAGCIFDDPQAGCYWWDTSPAQFMTGHLETGWLIQGNSANQLFFTAPKDYDILFTNGDVFTIRFCAAALDQVGRGSGDRIADITVNSANSTAYATYTYNVTYGAGLNFYTNQTWPHQVLEPVHAWANTQNGSPVYFGSGYANIVAGRDYTNVMDLNYTALSYPHPLDTTTNQTGTYGAPVPATYQLTVNGGLGSGSYSAGAMVTVVAQPSSGYIFTSWSGDTGYLANSSVPATSLVMPANAVTLTVNVTTNGAVGSTGSSDITSGLIARWPLAGNLYDYIGANNGTANGSPAYTAGPSGSAASAIGLNGVSQNVVTTPLGTFGNNCSSGFTFTAWVQSSYTSGYEAIFGSQGSAGMAVSLYLNFAISSGPGLIEGLVRDSSGALHTCDVLANSGITDGNWHFIAWTDNPSGNSGVIYVDGVPLNTVMPMSAASATVALPNAMGLGIREGLNDGLFNGSLSDCRIYNRMLSAAEVSTLYSNGKGTQPSPSGLTPPTNLQAHPPGSP